MYPKKDEKIIRGHSISGGMNNPPITKQLLEGKNLQGDDERKPLIFDDDIQIGLLYYDKREKFEVLPVKQYDDKIQISDGRSCTIEYARTYWELRV